MKSYFRNLCQQWSSGSATSRRNRGRTSSVQSLEQRHMLAADFQLLSDINRQEAAAADSNPNGFAVVGTTMYFTAHDGTSEGLWKTNGTATGTVLVKRMTARNGRSVITDSSVLNGKLYFVNVNELWVTDGTASGTTLIREFQAVNSIITHNNQLFLAADDGSHGMELWRSNGTATGTTLVRDIRPGGQSGVLSELVSAGSSIYFVGSSEDTPGVIENGLWKSSGTPVSTVEVLQMWDNQFGQSDSSENQILGSLLEMNGNIYFGAIDWNAEVAIWRSNGTPGGTRKFSDIGALVSDYETNLRDSVVVDNRFYFLHNHQLWTSDGTSSGTLSLHHPSLSFSHYWPQLTSVGAHLYFIQNSPTENGRPSNQLWRTDGTAAGTTLVESFPWSGAYSGRYLDDLIEVGGTLFFTEPKPGGASQLWRISGPTADPRAVMTFRPNSPMLGTQVANLNGELLFAADGGVHGNELWKSNGTSQGTAIVKNINASGPTIGSEASQLTNVNGVVFFTANDGTTGHELWKSDGTAPGTVLVKNIRSGSNGSNPESLTNVNGVLYFTANDGTNGYELWKSDGTAAGTVMVKNIRAGAAGSDPYSLVNVNGTLFFTADNGVNGRELWKSNGTAAGTVLVKDIAPGTDDSVSYYTKLTNVNGVLYFAADDETNGYELWKSNGTSAGTTLVKNIAAGDVSSLNAGSEMVNVSGRLFFVANDNVNGYQLWKSDGTSAGTSMVSMNAGVSYPHSLTNFAGNLFFSGLSGVGRELWRSDGTTSGTTLIADINTFSGGSSNPSDFTNVNGLLYFTANNGLTGTELWKTDGTSSGTTLVRNIASGGLSSSPYGLTNAHGVLYFTASDGANGRELWTSNGFFSGTTMVKQFRSGPSDSWPEPVVVVNDLLYVSADSDAFGRELFVANLTKGTSGNDAFTLRYTGTGQTATVTVTLSTNSGPTTTLGTFPATFALPIDGLGGNDSVLIEGTPGNDVFAVDSSGRITVNSARVVLSSIETRTFSGGAGNDTYRFDADGSIGSFQIRDTAGGTDTIDLSPTSRGVTLYLDRTTLQALNANLALQFVSGSIIENVIGGSGNDVITGNAANNTLIGNAGNDRLNGLAGNDSLIGGSGNDTYLFTNAATSESDTITEVANAGTDTIDFSGVTTPLTISLSTSATQTVHTRRALRLNSAANFENLIGGSSHDTLTGNAANNTLIGNAGNDRLNGLGGNDSLIGGAGNDTYIFINAATSESDTITEVANSGTDTIDFSALSVAITLNMGSALIQAVHANRTLRLNGASAIENATGGTGNDLVIGNTAANALHGNAGHDILIGRSGNDVLTGGSGRDILIGGLGSDILTGGEHDDILIGGYTLYDTSAINLTNLRESWLSNQSYASRVARLRTGTGVPITSLKAGLTVRNDEAAVDRLRGGIGSDWYFRALDDLLLDFATGELADLL